VNQNYIHTRALGDVTDHLEADRLEIVEDCAAVGVLTAADVAPRFGLTRAELTKWLNAKGVTFTELRDSGRRRFARTLFTAMEWQYSEIEVAEPWPVSNGTVRTWIQRYAREDEFEPPADPTVSGELEVGR